MSIYAIGDLHLSLSCEKPMDVFDGWDNYTQRIEKNWTENIKDEDTVIICGDISWGMSLNDSLEDFKFINKLPGQKIMLKGNHDYWWTTISKISTFFEENDLHTLKILHNNSYIIEGVAVCGSRGWIFESGEEFDKKIILREAQRLKLSLDTVKEDVEKIVFLHYPPVYHNEISQPIYDLMKEFSIEKCYYGHIHGAGHRYAINGSYLGIDFNLVSADFLSFNPLKVK